MSHDAPKDPRANIILITTDQQRADCMGCEGHPLLITPHMDLLAFQGTRFTRAYSDCPICIPARATIMNGKHAWAYGDPTYFEGKPMPIDHHKSLPGLLHDVGYKTQAIGKMHFYPQRCCYGFDNMVLTELDYQDYLLGTPYAGRAMGHGLGQNEVYPSRAMAPQEYSPTTWTVDETIRFLDKRDPTQPFFLWVSFTKPHPPFDPPAPYDTMYDPADVPDPVVSDWAAGSQCPRYVYKKRTSYKHDVIPPHVIKMAAAHYYGLITEIDYQMGRLFGALRERDLLDRSLICFASDHGEMLGDQKCFGKQVFYEGSARVPFILRLPENHPDFNPGQVCDAPVCLADILPTFARYADAEVPSDINGIDLLPVMKGDRSAGHEYLRCQCNDSYMLTDGLEKYLWYKWGGTEQLFNLRTDPKEKHNIAHGPIAQPTVEKWRRRLIEWLKEMGDPGTDGETLIPTDEPMPPDNILRAKNSLGLVERSRFPHDHEGRTWLLH